MTQPKNAFEIFKLLEKSNCGNCREKTCLAFAGAVFKGQRRLSECLRLEPGVAARFSEDSGTENAPEAEGAAHFDCSPNSPNGTAELNPSCPTGDYLYGSGIERIRAHIPGLSGATGGHRLARCGRNAGRAADGEVVVMPFFGRPYKVSAAGISDPSGSRPSHSVSVLLSKYLLMCPKNPPLDASWVSYKDFRDAGPFVGGFRNNAEVPLERTFGSNPAELRKRCEALGGAPAAEDFPYEVAMRLPALPKIPILLLFNGGDDEFPARCVMLFERRAEKYLDMECLAITGWALSAYLLEIPCWGSL